MNKQELVGAIAAKTTTTKKEVDRILSATMDAIIEAVSEGESVRLVGFGVFDARKRSARKARNPKTGEEVLIKEATIPYFHAGKTFKEEVNQ
jgi:DNA-binding protein HU-beta